MSETSKKINLSPSFLIKVVDKGYDYAVAEKLGLIQKDTKAMGEGRLIHALIAERLGGEKAKIAISPYDTFRTNEARAWRDSQPDDTEIVKEKDMERFNAIVDRVINHEKIKPFLEDCEPEKTITKEVNGFTVKGILDVLSKHNGGTWIDWKFVSSQVFDSFEKKALYQHYDLQSAVYDFLTQVPHGYFVSIESEAPYRIKMFHVDTSFLDSGAEKFDKAFNILKKANWRPVSFDIQEVGELVSWENYNG